MENKASLKETLAQLATNTAQCQKNTTTSIEALVVQIGEIATVLANMPQGSFAKYSQKRSRRARGGNYLRAAAKNLKEVEAYEEEEKSYVEDLKWLIDYYEKKLISDPLIMYLKG